MGDGGRGGVASRLTAASTAALVAAGCSQVLRQVMITDSVRRNGLIPDAAPDGRLDDAVAVVLARGDDRKARVVADALDAAVTIPVQFWSHAQLVTAAGKQTEFADLAAAMGERYLPRR